MNEEFNKEIDENINEKTNEDINIKANEEIKTGYVKPALEVSRIETVTALLFIPLCYIYAAAMFENLETARVLFGIFSLGFIVLTEILYRGRKRLKESIVFLACVLIIASAYTFNIGNVWEVEHKFFFLHMFAAYYVILRADCMAEGETSHLFAWDGINALLVYPFSNFPLGARTIGTGIFKGRKSTAKRVAASMVAVAIGLILLAMALNFLKDSDANYAHLLNRLTLNLEFGEIVVKLIVTAVVGSFLYGMVGGFFRADKKEIAESGKKLNDFLARINKISPYLWMGFIGLFTVFYIMFFALQGSYMFDAFRLILPKQYTFSQYAVKGFGDMCAVMVINFILLWFTMRTSEEKSKPVMICGAVLMADSFVFALIAFLKLFMYIRAYGFTPLRMQSLWLIVVLSFAVVCVLVSMFAHKKTAKTWFVISAASLALLTLV